MNADQNVSTLTALDIYERQDAERQARTCPGCKVESGSERDNADGRSVWFFWACDEAELMPCATCRPREAAVWMDQHGEHDEARRIRAQWVVGDE